VIARAVAFAAFGLFAAAGLAHAQGMILSIEINQSSSRPVRPSVKVNTLQEFMAALAGCWSPPPLDVRRSPVDLTFQVSFKRSGELFGKPRVVNFARQVTQEERERYQTAVVEAIDRCSPMPFTESMGGAVAGRTFRVNFLDRRNSKRAEVPWLAMTTS
jgi:hypothetical protein